MKYIKAYEKQKIVFTPNTYCLIKGKKEKVIEILEKIQQFSRKKIQKEDLIGIINTLTTGQYPKFGKEYKGLKGIYLGIDSGFRFFPIRKNKEKDGVDFYEGENYTYIGELKLIKDELVLDTFDIDIAKYNIL